MDEQMNEVREKIASLICLELCSRCGKCGQACDECPIPDYKPSPKVDSLIQPLIEQAKQEVAREIGEFINQNQLVQGKQHIPWWEVAELLKDGDIQELKSHYLSNKGEEQPTTDEIKASLRRAKLLRPEGDFKHREIPNRLIGEEK